MQNLEMDAQFLLELKNEIKSHYDALASILMEEVDVYQELLESIKQERSILLKPSLEKIHESNSRKETLLLKARMLEEVRMKTAAKLARLLELDSDRPGLSDLISHAEGPQKKRLQECRFLLHSVLKNISEMNKANKLLLDSSLIALEGCIDFIADLMCTGSTYLKSGEVNHNTGNGRLLRTRG
ncbi:MAG: flagellar protein FlgN [Syntrophales bacterium]